jgi:hypothetical protein
MSEPLLFVDTSESNVTVTGNLNVTSNLSIIGGVIGDLNIAGDTSITGDLDVSGDVHISGSLRKTRARMIRLESSSKSFTSDGWQTYVPYGDAWTAYSSDPLYSISISGDYVDTSGRAIHLRIAVKNQRTNVVTYFPSSSGWIKYLYIDHSRLDGHGYLGIMSGLIYGDSYKVQLEVDPNTANPYRWNSAYGTLTGLVWD